MLPAPTKKKESNQPMTATRRLLAGLRDGKMADIELVGDDGIHVPALRCVLACASPVMHKLLYGDSKKAASPLVKISGCSNKTLRALVEYCCSDELNASIWDGNCPPAEIVKDIVALARVSHAYAIPNMEERVLEGINPLMAAIPPLACVVFNFADINSTREIHRSALHAIRERPYICLQQDGQSVGGIVSLFPDKLKEIFRDTSIEVDELFLFKALLRWRAYNQDTYSNVNAICRQLVSYVKLSNIDPNDLKTYVIGSDLVDERTIIDALLEQSITATKEGLAFATLRGKRLDERVRVMIQGAGSSECNGIYKQVHREGTLLCYSKRVSEKRTLLLLKDSHMSWKICDNHHVYYEWKGSREDQYDQFPVSGWTVTAHTAGESPAPTVKWFRINANSARVPTAISEKVPVAPTSSTMRVPLRAMPPPQELQYPSPEEEDPHETQQQYQHHRTQFHHLVAPKTPTTSHDHHHSIQRSASHGAPQTPIAVRVSPRTPSPMLSFAPASLPTLKESATWQI